MNFFIPMFLLLPNLSFATTYNCSIEHKDELPEKNKKLWSGTLNLKGTKETASEVIVIKPDGNGISLNKITMDKSKDLSKMALAEFLKSKLSPFEGNMAIGLKTEGGKLFISSGQVDTSKSENMIPFNAIAWTSKDAKEVGVKDFKKDLELSCRLK